MPAPSVQQLVYLALVLPSSPEIAIRAGCRVATRHQARLVTVHPVIVRSPAALDDDSVLPGESAAMRAADLATLIAAEYDVPHEALIGRALALADLVLYLADSLPADVICLPAPQSAWAALGMAINGDLRRLLREAPCPLLLVPPTLDRVEFVPVFGGEDPREALRGV